MAQPRTNAKAAAMIEIDGSQGEGGGQILRSALALSMATGNGFRMARVRAGRAKPGLMRQHLTCFQAAAAICNGRIQGAAIGSTEVSFMPGTVVPGDYSFAVGSAGSTMLVLQALLPALLRAGESTLTIEGGTHCASAPPFEFIDRALVPLLNRAGANVRLRMERHGFYPAGGGKVVVEISPQHTADRFELFEAGERLGIDGDAIVSRLPMNIALRELDELRTRLSLGPDNLRALAVPDAVGPGNAVIVTVRDAHITEVFSAMGSIGRSAEAVASEAVDALRAHTHAGRPVGAHLADQLMVPLAVLGGGAFATGPLTQHSRTNITTLGLFGVNVKDNAMGVVEVAGI